MYSKYCDPGGPSLTFSSPRSNIVSVYITELPEISYLPRCAQSALAGAVMGVPSGLCPVDANLYAPCVCNKGYVVSQITEYISSSVRASCSNNQDVTLAENFYNDYCNMNNGTTEFAPPAGPPGDSKLLASRLIWKLRSAKTIWDSDVLCDCSRAIQ